MQTTQKKIYDAPSTEVVWVEMDACILEASPEQVTATRQGYGVVYSDLDGE